MFDKLKKSHKPYVKKIMYQLYPDKCCDTDTLCSKFVKKYHKIVRASIKDLEKCRLIESMDNPLNNSEKKYMLTSDGKSFMDLEISLNQEKEKEA